MQANEIQRVTHRAHYTLEMGDWYATCRVCGHRISDKDRRRAAAQFRRHIQEMAAEPASVLDLRSTAPGPDLAGNPEGANRVTRY